MQKWETAQPFVFDQAASGTSFTAIEMAIDLGVTVRQASDLIQSYLRAQRRKNSPTLFVLHRTGRTRGSVWHVGARTADAKGMSQQTASDMTARVMRALGPDLKRMGVMNPRVAGLAQAMTAAFVANLNALVAALP